MVIVIRSWTILFDPSQLVCSIQAKRQVHSCLMNRQGHLRETVRLDNRISRTPGNLRRISFNVYRRWWREVMQFLIDWNESLLKCDSSFCSMSQLKQSRECRQCSSIFVSFLFLLFQTTRIPLWLMVDANERKPSIGERCEGDSLRRTIGLCGSVICRRREDFTDITDCISR